eukprot:1160002-Pelagomonas_calceolata.AAC.9
MYAKQTKDLELSNPSKKAIAYTARLQGHSDFSVDASIVHIDAKVGHGAVSPEMRTHHKYASRGQLCLKKADPKKKRKGNKKASFCITVGFTRCAAQQCVCVRACACADVQAGWRRCPCCNACVLAQVSGMPSVIPWSVPALVLTFLQQCLLPCSGLRLAQNEIVQGCCAHTLRQTHASVGLAGKQEVSCTGQSLRHYPSINKERIIRSIESSQNFRHHAAGMICVSSNFSSHRSMYGRLLSA